MTALGCFMVIGVFHQWSRLILDIANKDEPLLLPWATESIRDLHSPMRGLTKFGPTLFMVSTLQLSLKGVVPPINDFPLNFPIIRSFCFQFFLRTQENFKRGPAMFFCLWVFGLSIFMMTTGDYLRTDTGKQPQMWRKCDNKQTNGVTDTLSIVHCRVLLCLWPIAYERMSRFSESWLGRLSVISILLWILILYCIVRLEYNR